MWILCLIIKIREHGAIRGMIADINKSNEEILAELKATPVLDRHVEQVSIKWFTQHQERDIVLF